jgi:DNA processing protein
MSHAVAETTISEAGRKFLRLQSAENIGPIRTQSLLKHFGDIDAVLRASMAELQHVDGIGRQSAEAIVRSRQDQAAIEREIARARECGVRILCIADPDYPQSLRYITDPPICLYVRGTIEPADAVAVAIVGTRKCSHYGREQATRFGELLGRAGFTVVSGLARGIDGHAHRGALRAGGRTIAVLGNGVGSIYPPEHEELAADIAKSGAVVSELPIDASPEATNFPGRNRIITGLSLGVLVIEAGKRSGALITARLALEYNRDVFALPGNVDRGDLTAGTNGLIRDGAAKLVTCLEDILDELGEVGAAMRPESVGEQATPGNASAAGEAALNGRLSAGQRTVLEAVRAGAGDVDGICEQTALSAGFIMATLTHLELAGAVMRLPGNRYSIRGEAT